MPKQSRVLIESTVYASWFGNLHDRTTKVRIATRIDRLANGNAGDHKGVGEGVMELVFEFGPGFRVYYKAVGPTVILLLAGGDKASQAADIRRAKAIAAAWSEKEWKT